MLLAAMPTHRTPPWKKPNERNSVPSKLSPTSIAWAKKRANKAGRRYPNLIDNMAATRRQREAAQPPEKLGSLTLP